MTSETEHERTKIIIIIIIIIMYYAQGSKIEHGTIKTLK